MLKTDYIKAFTKAIEEADLENENVARNLDNALVMASAKYEDNDCVNVEGLTSNGKWELTDPVFNFGINRYRLKPEPQYKPFDYESVKEYLEKTVIPIDFPSQKLVMASANTEGVYLIDYVLRTARCWVSFNGLITDFTLDGKPAGVEV